MSRARFQVSADFLSRFMTLGIHPLSTTLPQDIRILEVSEGEDGIFWFLVESDEIVALDDEVPEIEVWYWGGTPERG